MSYFQSNKRFSHFVEGLSMGFFVKIFYLLAYFFSVNVVWIAVVDEISNKKNMQKSEDVVVSWSLPGFSERTVGDHCGILYSEQCTAQC